MKIILVHTTLIIVFLSILFTGCSKDEDNSDNNINLPGAIDLFAVGMANFSAPSSRASTEPVVVDTVKITDDLYATVSITEASEEIATRANETPKLPQNTRFRLIALDNDDVKVADIVYQIKNSNGNAEIVSGSGEGYKVGAGGKKYFQLEPGKSYKMVGFSDGTSNTPGNIDNPLTYTWKSNYMKFVTTLTVADGINQFGPTFQHMNTAMQIVINTSKTGNNVTSASAVMWQERYMPIQNKWIYTTDGYENNLTYTNGSETNSSPFVWTNPNSQNVVSDLQYFTPGVYGSIKLKFKNITVGGVDYNEIEPIPLDPVKMAFLQRNKKYIVTVNFIPPFNVTITDNLRSGKVNEPRLVIVTATGAQPPYSYEWTIVCNGETSTFINTKNTYQHSLDGNYKRMDYTAKCIVHDSSGKQVGVSLKSVLKQVVRKTVAEVPESEVPWMQNWNSSLADAEIVDEGANVNRVRYVRDQRDNTIYRIKKMADGRWWMMQGMAWEGLTPMGLIDPGVPTAGNPPSVKVRSNLQGDIQYRNDMINTNQVCPVGWRTPTYNGDYPNLFNAVAPTNTNIYQFDVTNSKHWEAISTAHCLSYNNETYPRDFMLDSPIYGASEYFYLEGHYIQGGNRWGHNKFSLRCVKQ